MEEKKLENQKSYQPAAEGHIPQNRFQRSRNPRGDRGGKFGSSKNGFIKRKQRNDKKPKDTEENLYETQVIQVRRVTRVVKGGKRMRFSALVIVGDKQGKIGFGLQKGLDYQESVTKATRKAKESMVKVSLTESGTLGFQSTSSFKSSTVFLKPAQEGTGLIAGGFIRPVLELAGVKNIYSKIIGTRNKITGVKSVFKALEKYSMVPDFINK
jgi:small subunit ribosomal protein S5